MSNASKSQHLQRVNDCLGATPDSAQLLFQKACLLTELGKMLEARDAYFTLLSIDSTHREALNNLGSLLYEARYRSAAKTAFTQAVLIHPTDPVGHVNLANLWREEGNLTEARRHYELALSHDANNHYAHQGLALVLTEAGEEESAATHRQQGFEHCAISEIPYRGEGQPVNVLLLVSAIGGNTPTKNFLDSGTYHTYVVVAEFFHVDTVLPPHQLVFNAISDVDLVGPAIEAAQAIVERSSAPVINLPAQIRHTSRADITERFANLPGVVTPMTIMVSRKLLTAPDAMNTLCDLGFQFPILVRSPGYHTGRHFVKVDTSDHLDEAIVNLPGEELMVIQYLDARGRDGKYRKYRVMMIDGHLYPLHLAISTDWKIHYFTAELMNDAEYCREEERFLEDMEHVIGSRALKALTDIQTSLGLDYAGIDFGMNDAGEILLFEANATMVVNTPEPLAHWTYRQKPVAQIFAAVRKMLMGRVK